MSIRYQSFEKIDEKLLGQISDLNNEIFIEFKEFVQPFSKEKMAQTALNVAGFHLLVAYDDEKAIGFKAGYRHSGRRFYSWLGGVLGSYRGQGIAKNLMQQQHQWAEEQGYSVVETRTKNCFRSMLLANIKYGFNVVGVTASVGDTEPVIVLEKPL